MRTAHLAGVRLAALILTVLVGSHAVGGDVARYDVVELASSWATAAIANPWEDVTLSATFRAPSGASVTVPGFYDGGETYRVRFAPVEVGEYTWTSVIGSGSTTSTSSGSFVCVASPRRGFVRQNPRNPYRWVFDDGTAYHPIGIGDCIPQPMETAQWGIDATSGFTLPPTTYFSTYGACGMNLFRLSIDNCAPKLWDTIAPGGNRYLIAEGQSIDRLCRLMRDNGLRIYFDFFGFNPPYPAPSPDELAALERYAGYVVARYGAYVDFWELMNEATVTDPWYSAFATYVRTIDPYRHPIGTSWEQPANTAIEMSNPHWYETEDELSSDAITWNDIAGWKSDGKPVIVGEQGNSGSNWDARSGVRMRLRLWTSLFAEGSLVFWNTSGTTTYQAPAGNLYIGPEERGYIRVLSDFAGAVDAGAVITPLATSRPDAVRGYALRSPSMFAAYLVKTTDHTTPIAGVTATLDNPLASGEARWIDPATGAALAQQTVANGRVTLTAPDFTTDVALVITAAVADAPAIVTPPADQSVQSGQRATFRVAASGSAPLAYQWQRDGVDIAGANASVCTTPPVTAGDDGSTYRCLVSNAVGSTLSSSATLTVSGGTTGGSTGGSSTGGSTGGSSTGGSTSGTSSGGATGSNGSSSGGHHGCGAGSGLAVAAGLLLAVSVRRSRP